MAIDPRRVMQLSRANRRLSLPLRAAFLSTAAIAAIGLAVGAMASSGSSHPTKRVLKEAQNQALGKVVLTTKSGLTLYSLSVEKHGKFICKTKSCLADWHPLVVPAGTKPTGPVPLGTVKRPDDRIQVTYRGRPLYSFDDDAKAGEANGEGFKDVGTWHAASPPASQSPPAPTPAPPSGYGY
jgi:predicted lipoprotein with Yx(FWY)xxD motif